jgi:protein-disulfide isomerase
MSKSTGEVISLNIEAFLMPVAIVVATFIFSVSMYASASKISKMETVGAGNQVAANNFDQPTFPTDEVIDEGPIFTQTTLGEYVKGDQKKAKVAIVEYSDFECPFCKRFYDETLSQILEEYKDDVVFSYRHLPLGFHALAQIQAEATECAGVQGKYYDMHDYIFDNGGVLDADKLKEGAATLGLNIDQFNKCLDNGEKTQKVNDDAAAASAAGVNGTPGFVVGTFDKDGNVDGQVISGAMPFASFKEVIDSYL